jgi:C-terminal processing protease CtpA/Prc
VQRLCVPLARTARTTGDFLCLQGLVLVEAKDRKGVVVEEIVKGGNADQSGQVQVGDILTK